MQKITPCLWFNDQLEEAVNFYISAFKNGQIFQTARYDEAGAKAAGRPAGSVMTMTFELLGHKFMGLNGGPHFKFNPSVSFFVNFDPSKNTSAKENQTALWQKLSENGKVLMPLDTYPFSKHYGWVQDKYGVSWQLILSNPDGDLRPDILPSFMFVNANCGKAEEAAEFYMSVFKDSERGIIARYPAGMEPDKEGTVMYTDFMIENYWIASMDSAQKHDFAFNEAVSFVINCNSQEEIDYYWDKLLAIPQQCGWLKDKYGLSWQIVPKNMGELLSGKDKEKSKRAMQAMLQMKKIDIKTLENA
ncbi:MAG: VOC family protein [Calditrichae bacterium]|nr:VOC family protein [Calditrichia bacterium]